jgi:integrase
VSRINATAASGCIVLKALGRRGVTEALFRTLEALEHQFDVLATLGLGHNTSGSKRTSYYLARSTDESHPSKCNVIEVRQFAADAIKGSYGLVTGMRISETVAIEIDKHIEPDCSIIYVRQQREKDVNALKPDLKTEAGLRDIDLHPDAARILRNFIGGRTTGFLFQTANGTMLDPGNIDRDSLSPILEEMCRDEVGTRFNVFRRFPRGCAATE